MTLTSELTRLLETPDRDADARWRALFSLLMASGPSLDDLREIWDALLRFDPVMRAAVSDPMPTPGSTVIVAGSGKETLKTFNVSTAAAVLAAAAGALVVKGVSRSVSAVSGSEDMLEHLGIPVCDGPSGVAGALGRHGVAFVPYMRFCPYYGQRYDGVFNSLTPVSFFAPVAVLAVRAGSYVYGLADTRVSLAAAAIAAARPDLQTGAVVGAQPIPGKMVDEYVAQGTSYMALSRPGCIAVNEHRRAQASPDWASAVAHRSDHASNASVLLRCLQSGPVDPARDLVERNAALILDAARGFTLSQSEALATARQARQEGRAAGLLRDMMRDLEAA